MDKRKLVPFVIKSLNNEIKRIFDKSALKNNESLTGMHCAIISYVANQSREQDVFQRDVEKEFNIRRPTATNILQLMEKKELLLREPVADDGRLRKIVLTEKALNMRVILEQELNTMGEVMVKDIPQEQLDVFFTVTEKISKNIKLYLD